MMKGGQLIEPPRFILVAIGGGIVAGFTAGQHIPWLTENGCIFTYFGVWLVVNFCPGDIITSILIRQPFYFTFRVYSPFFPFFLLFSPFSSFPFLLPSSF